METSTVRLPTDLAESLVGDGYARWGSDQHETRGAGGDMLQYAFSLFGAGGTTVSLILHGPEARREIAQRIAKWRRSAPELPDGKPYELRARGPRGSIDLTLDEAPDAEAIEAFLKQVFDS